MPKIEKFVFRRVTPSDFYWINQSGSGTGGNQSYFDFNTGDVSKQDWESFFDGTEAEKSIATSGPYWTFSVKNLGANNTQDNVKLGQRRATSFSIRSQKLPEHSQSGKRLHAWRPANGFPAIPNGITSAGQVPANLIEGLRIFLLRDDQDQIWAGWMRQEPNALSDPLLKRIFELDSAMLNIAGKYKLDTNSPNWPFVLGAASIGAADEGDGGAPLPIPDEMVSAAAQGGDNSSISHFDWEDWDSGDELAEEADGVTYKMQQVKKRNRSAVKKLKDLYAKCQMTGDQYIFQSKTGKPYLEVHHLIPLGEGGADAPYNMVVLSAHAHRLLHHANVSGLDLSLIKDNRLEIEINGEKFSIEWHPKHFELIEKSAPASEGS